MHRTQKRLEEERIYTWLTLPHRSPTEGCQGSNSIRNLEAETEVETIEKCCHLACSVYSLIELSYTTQRWYHLQWASPLISIINQEKSSRTCLLDNLMEAMPQLRYPLPGFFWICTKLCQVDKILTSATDPLPTSQANTTLLNFSFICFQDFTLMSIYSITLKCSVFTFLTFGDFG